jgi:hypothetical protein
MREKTLSDHAPAPWWEGSGAPLGSSPLHGRSRTCPRTYAKPHQACRQIQFRASLKGSTQQCPTVQRRLPGESIAAEVAAPHPQRGTYFGPKPRSDKPRNTSGGRLATHTQTHTPHPAKSTTSGLRTTTRTQSQARTAHRCQGIELAPNTKHNHTVLCTRSPLARAAPCRIPMVAERGMALP